MGAVGDLELDVEVGPLPEEPGLVSLCMVVNIGLAPEPGHGIDEDLGHVVTAPGPHPGRSHTFRGLPGLVFTFRGREERKGGPMDPGTDPVAFGRVRADEYLVGDRWRNRR